MAILEVRNVTREYQMKAETVRALSGISVSIEPGEFVAILGTSGSGKSTLLHLLGGLDRPTSGEILFDGRSLAPLTSREMAAYRRTSVGMIFQSFHLLPTMTARENVMIALAFGGMSRRDRYQRAAELLDRVGLSHRLDHLPSELSGGEQQRVSIARALANRPKVLLADEPTGNLDSRRAADILDLLATLCREEKMAVLLVTHDEALASAYASRIIRLRDGEVVPEGEPR
ncbi:MAG: ABC transporter ATP-binding protein [Blastocatellia bacterium]|jgi:putative ABC transport system ATP-binding protein